MGETREPADLIARCYLGDLFFPEYASRFRLEFINFLHRQLENRISFPPFSNTRANNYFDLLFDSRNERGKLILIDRLINIRYKFFLLVITFSYTRILKNKRLIQSSFFSLHSFIFVSFQPAEKRSHSRPEVFAV